LYKKGKKNKLKQILKTGNNKKRKVKRIKKENEREKGFKLQEGERRKKRNRKDKKKV
jgi:hypothetical protein